mmetsp:Transcript_19072/g.28844  ORF Transcript_19072/g.28844 Transcript_19072/m.28844 type:complete len:307 (+) Transcript_19072:23-943(+)
MLKLAQRRAYIVVLLLLLWMSLIHSDEEALSEMMTTVAEEAAADAAQENEEALDATRAETIERDSYGSGTERDRSGPWVAEKKIESEILQRRRGPPKLSGVGAKSTATKEQAASKEEHTVPADLKELYEMIADGEAAAAEAARRREMQLRARYGLGSLEDADRRLRAYEALAPRERRTLDAAVARVLRTKRNGHYAVLGIRRSCRPAAIKRAYRSKALLVHPDRNPHLAAPEAFDALTLAHETLSNPISRRQYDRKLQKKALMRRAKLGRTISSLFDTAREYIAFRSKQYPVSFFAAAFLAFALII